MNNHPRQPYNQEAGALLTAGIPDPAKQRPTPATPTNGAQFHEGGHITATPVPGSLALPEPDHRTMQTYDLSQPAEPLSRDEWRSMHEHAANGCPLCAAHLMGARRGVAGQKIIAAQEQVRARQQQQPAKRGMTADEIRSAIRRAGERAEAETAPQRPHESAGEYIARVSAARGRAELAERQRLQRGGA